MPREAKDLWICVPTAPPTVPFMSWTDVSSSSSGIACHRLLDSGLGLGDIRGAVRAAKVLIPRLP